MKNNNGENIETQTWHNFTCIAFAVFTLSYYHNYDTFHYIYIISLHSVCIFACNLKFNPSFHIHFQQVRLNNMICIQYNVT